MKFENKSITLLWPLAMIVVAAVTVLIGSLWVWSREVDDSSRQREESQFDLAIAQMADIDAKMMTPITIWNKAVESTSVTYDPKWVHDNIGVYFKNYLSFDRNYLLNAEDQPVYAFRDNAEDGTASYISVGAQIQPLINKLRSRRDNPNFNSFNYESGLIVADGHAYITGVSLILPDHVTDAGLSEYTPYVAVAMQELTQAHLDHLAKNNMLNNIVLQPHNYALAPNQARRLLKGLDDKTVAVIAWVPDKPGSVMFNKAMIPVMLISLGLGAIAIWLLHRSQKVAHSLIASEAKAKYMAMHDQLTGLPNRQAFVEKLCHARERIKRQGGHIAVLCIGLDRFKDVNDALGHSSGDELIRQHAKTLSSMLRSTDTIARISGDEFVIIQTECDALSSAGLAARVLQNLSGDVTLANGKIYASCSIGITLINDCEIDPNETLRQADMALCSAKALGRGQYVFFETEMDTTIKLRKLLESSLRDAIKNDEIEVVYQPQVDSQNALIGVEALARWTHPDRGPISPSYFIPMAEECGLIADLGAAVLKKAMTDAHRWPDLKVAVNVSVIQLMSEQFMAQVKSLLESTQMSPTRIELEITESVLSNDQATVQAILRELRAMGFSIALDDFGTGYSSLSYLSRYPVDKIKIDRSFVSNLGVDPEAEAVVRAIIKLAKALNLNILAEGVETKQQRSVLRSAGCHIIQGYFFSKPVDTAEIDKMMEYQAKHVMHLRSAQSQAMMR